MCTCDCALNIGVGGFTPRLTVLELPSVIPCAYCVHTVAYILISLLSSFYSNLNIQLWTWNMAAFETACIIL
jgi:hypothetical protein